MGGWRETTLGEVCDEVNGIIQTGPFGSQLHQSDYSEVGIPVVMPKDIIEGRIASDTVARVSTEHVERLSRHKLRSGDIVYGRRGDIGRQALIRPEQAGWMCGTGCLRLSLGDNVLNPLFLHYYLRQDDVVGWITNQAVGATMPNLNTGILRSVPVKFPPLPVQQRIAGILSAYDELIENSQRRIKILESMARALYREWFVHFRFPGHENHPRVASPLGEIPQGWGVKKLKDVCRLTMGQSPKSEFYNDVGDGLPFHQGVTDFGDRFPTDRLFCTAEGRVGQAGDILFSVRAPVGRMNIANKKIILGRGLSAIRHNGDSQAFLWEQLRNRFTKDDMMGNGAIFASVTKDDMAGIELVCPPSSVVETATKHFEPLHSEIATLSQQVQNLRRTRDLLLPR
ncbi:MAG: restriction endonuclease subunit S, partial [Dechloromonas sp.]|nr:restriction endonuclease subunit S [Candidatus Dechloromonas phosphorivorans]